MFRIVILTVLLGVGVLVLDFKSEGMSKCPCPKSLPYKDIPPETQFLLLESEQGGPYVVFLPLIDNNSFRATLRPGGNA